MVMARGAPSRLAPRLYCSLPAASLRLASTARPQQGGGSGGDSSSNAERRAAAHRLTLECDRKFFINGRLLTTLESRDFLLKYGIEPDNGRMMPLRTGDHTTKHVWSLFHSKILFSPRHVMNPFDIRYFDPKGHALAPKKRSEYARKVRDESLWIFFTSRGNVSAVVRGLTLRRMARALYTALEARGYDEAPGRGSGKEIRGTLWVTVFDPVAAAAQDAKLFGETLAAVLDRQVGADGKASDDDADGRVARTGFGSWPCC